MKNNIYLSRICGKLLGDVSCTKQENQKSRFQFQHRVEDIGWTKHCYTQLRDFLPLAEPIYRKVSDKRLKKGYSESYVVQSRTSLIITNLYETWYPFSKKQLPFNFLHTYLNAEALAWWYQDDGHLKISNGIMQKITFSTDGFTTKENELLIKFLEHRFKITFTLDEQNHLILYNQWQIIYFLYLITP